MVRKRTRSRSLIFIEVPLPVSDGIAEMQKTFPNLKLYSCGPCQVLVGVNEDYGYYLEINRVDRLPSIEEILAARRQLIPHNIDMAIYIPPVDTGKFTLQMRQVTMPQFKPIRDPQGRYLGAELGPPLD